ncbi:1,2-phenylacetyl-CoA epoxidase subunit PaaC [Haloechinothrix sp. LS1_15]|uniref:1,2-phenylacetyl-CoA epoxidase subunit PaaC n=1 Tax=Haloechinothrix sp. LS1_15 TaxID=2652248 RepID=UPI0029462A85|nr:1,2-phenylacetyl-CoA epoxidase subunit PaaC [Haloechinothrix sp. LS1_15]MDV6013678.1 phenylacetate-CoA oxygenase subunit PaaC [Haloechinothrix sp. LS1_15]
MAFDNAYEAITEQNDARWAFGTGFDDPLAATSVTDTAIPAGIAPDDLVTYCLMLADDALVLSHRLQEWCTHAPDLEEEVALANIALDLLGQARLLYSRAGQVDGYGRGEDELAFFRAEHEFGNVRLVEPRLGDFARLIVTLLVFATWRLALLQRLSGSADPVLAAIAAKGVKEVTYHRDYAASWAVRLGDGTDYSHARAAEAAEAVWPLVDELFSTHPVEQRAAAAGVGVDPATVAEECASVLRTVLTTATLSVPEVAPLSGVAGRAGRHGVHTETMGYLLAELQSVARAHPEATW